MNEFERRIAPFSPGGLHSLGINILQLNLGPVCNQSCRHCHLSASPARGEMMPWKLMRRVLALLESLDCELLDITGGAPELHPELPRFIDELCLRGRQVQVRTNLSVLLEEGREGMAEFFRSRRVKLVASLPCYLEENVRVQRGAGVYEKSIRMLQRLNGLGYGREPGLDLDLVYNPAGPFLPPGQAGLEQDYRRNLGERFGIVFSRLLTITNMPIGNFWVNLGQEQERRRYLELLRESFNPRTLEGLMCRRQLSVGWDGGLYDCDFNLALGVLLDHGAPRRLEDFDARLLARRRIVTGVHCFGCTAGHGSSCGGALT